LTHGHPLNASGVFYNIVAYGVTQDEHLIDYNEVMEKALEHQPAMILAGFSAYSRKIEWSEFTKICDAVEATHGYRPLLMVDMAHVAGLIA
jgi:glycine hydroxymethyltransferase